MTFSGMRIVVTGGLGFIGSNLVHALARQGAHVAVIDALLPGLGGNRHNLAGITGTISVHEIDLRATAVLPRLLENADVVFNLAGALSHIDSSRDPFTDMECNVRAQLSLLEACRVACPRAVIVFTGSRSQYGRAATLPVNEDAPLHPVDLNGVHCVAAEQHHLLYHRLYGLRTVCLRLTNTYGPRHQMQHGRQGYLNWFIRLALEDRELPVYGDGTQLRDFNYVDDVVHALLAAATTPAAIGQVCNLGSGQAISVRASAEAVIASAGSGRLRLLSYPETLRGIEAGDYCADIRRAHALLIWSPRVPFAEGLQQTITFYRQHPDAYFFPEVL